MIFFSKTNQHRFSKVSTLLNVPGKLTVKLTFAAASVAAAAAAAEAKHKAEQDAAATKRKEEEEAAAAADAAAAAAGTCKQRADLNILKSQRATHCTICGTSQEAAVYVIHLNVQ